MDLSVSDSPQEIVLDGAERPVILSPRFRSSTLLESSQDGHQVSVDLSDASTV